MNIASDVSMSPSPVAALASVASADDLYAPIVSGATKSLML